MMEKEKQLIPELRFSEFEDNWKEKTLGDFADVSKLAGYEFTKHIKYESSGAIIALRGLNIKNNNLNLNDVKYIDNSELSKLNRSKLYVDDLMFTYIGTIGEVALIQENDRFYLAPNVSRIRFKKEVVFPKFMLQQFCRDEFKNKEVKTYVSSSSQPALTMENVRKFKINFPSLLEQQKIASFLTAIDAKITKLTKKKALLAQYKKGVMQKIFKQEIRFKDDNGNMFPDWEEKKLGVIGSIVSGLTYSPNDINENGVLVLRSSNVKKRLIALNDNVFVNIEEGKFNPVELNDILICVRNGSKRLIGKNAIIKEEHIGLAFGAFMTVYRSEYNRFLFHFFDSQYYKKEVHKNLGATINSINGGDLKKFKVPFPCIAEQTKIANFLSAIDLKIEALNNKIENSKNFKKGLLQQMFV